MESKFSFKMFSFMILSLFSTIIYSSGSFKGLPQGSTKSPFLMQNLKENGEISLDEQSQTNLIIYATRSNFNAWPEGASLKVESVHKMENGEYKVRIAGRWKEVQFVNNQPFRASMCKIVDGEIAKETLEKYNILVP